MASKVQLMAVKKRSCTLWRTDDVVPFFTFQQKKNIVLYSPKSLYLLSLRRLNGECFTSPTSEEQTIMALFGSQCLKMVMVMVMVMKLQCISLEKLYVKVYVHDCPNPKNSFSSQNSLPFINI